MMDTAQVTYRLSKGPCRHKKTWWWNEEVSEAVRERKIDIDDMHFGFMRGKGTTDAIFIVRLMQEKFSAKGKKLYFGFMDLEKLLRVPRDVTRWAMHNLGFEEWLLSALSYEIEFHLPGTLSSSLTPHIRLTILISAAEVQPYFPFLRARSHFRATHYFAHNCCTISLSLSMIYPY